MAENLFKPLQMTDTDFMLSEGKKDRMVSYYLYENDTLTLLESKENSVYLNQRMIYSGGSGLISTAKDYANFVNYPVPRAQGSSHR